MSFIREPNAEPILGYRLIEPLGSGGFGEAWKCEAPGGLFKAIKFVFGNLNSLDMDGARAEQELKSLNRVKEVRYPFVLSMDRIEVVGGELVIVMELADRSLHDSYEECLAAGLVGIPRERLLRYVRDAAEGLDHMNEKHNLQHLDIKPRNLFVVSDRVKVGDFGLVKHLERSGASGMLGGVTPLYAAPETFTGGISGRSDQYSLAVVYQELLTGQRPFNGKNARQLAQQHMNEAPELRALPEAERPVVARALSKDPAKRFPNCLAFVRALYTARTTFHSETQHPENGGRPKTMADCIEDVLLEELSQEEERLGDLASQQANKPGSHPDLGAPQEEHSRLGMTVPQPSTGALRPTLIIGLGAFGRRALLELRCRFLDRFGDLDRAPLFRFLYIDVDADAVRAATRGSPEVALKPSEVYHLPLQQVSHYRRRQLDHLNDWLPREKLYTMPRSLKTQGSRALGRLAFSDNYMRLVGRFRRDIQQAVHPDALYQSVTNTGLALRDNTPRVYVLAAAGGGASGCLTDLGFGLRRLLKQMHHPDAPVTALVFCGAPDDPATPPGEQANVYATLTELNHFADPCVPFAAQYGADGPRLSDEGSAFDSVYILPHANRTPESRRDALAHLGSYLFHEMTTPLGLRLDACRMQKSQGDAVCFRSLGTYGIWFPRGLLLRLAARRVCQRLLEQWQMPVKEDVLLGEEGALLEAAQARVLADPELQPESLARRIAEAAAIPGEGVPGEALTRMLASIEEQSRQMIAQDDPAIWAQQALSRVRDWLGSGIPAPGAPTIQQRKSKMTKALETAAAQMAEKWDAWFTEAAYGLLDHPGRRLALGEAALARFIGYCNDAAAAHAERLQLQAPRAAQAEQQLQTALENCATGGGFSWFGGNRSRRQLRLFVDHLAAYARQCMADDIAAVVGQFFAGLCSRLSDRLRDLTLCRQRLRHMQDTLVALENGDYPCDDEATNGLRSILGAAPSPDLSPSPVLSTEAFWEAVRESATHRVVLPEGVEQLETAANRFLASLNTEHWSHLDQTLQDKVLAARQGLFQACMNTNDLIRHLAVPLVNQAVATLGDYLPITDVAQVELASAGESAADACVAVEGELIERMQTYQELAAPLIGSAAKKHAVAVGPDGPYAGHAGGDAGGDAPPAAAGSADSTFLLIPASPAGKQYGEVAHRVLPGVHIVNVPGQADLMFCREQNEVTVEDLDRILRACRPAYEDAAGTPQSSPHARFDIQDWTPLDP